MISGPLPWLVLSVVVVALLWLDLRFFARMEPVDGPEPVGPEIAP